jgi:hypothetical protein
MIMVKLRVFMVDLALAGRRSQLGQERRTRPGRVPRAGRARPPGQAGRVPLGRADATAALARVAR